ncbi:MAG TPA: DUF1488 family protein [Candidatus Binatia bacterium]|nr:DUF1488 family protein [Candidatus Binatia bacterium]
MSLKLENTMDAEFFADEWYEPHRRKIVWFSAVLDEKCIDCGVTIDALVELFGAFQDDPLPAFRKHREEIWAIAEKLLASAASKTTERC